MSTQIEVKYYEDQHGMMMIRGPNQVTLVDGGHSSIVGNMRNSDNDGFYDITITDWEGHAVRNVTNKMEGGALDAYMTIRDHDIPHLIDKNNEMAFTLANEVNAVHQNGFGLRDYAERTGRNFFEISGDVDDAARSIDIETAILQSNDAIAAASTPQAPGDNININRILRIKEAKIFP